MNWFVLYTKPKAEDAVAQMLRNAGIVVLNPKIRTRKYVRKRYVDVIEQLFPCYLFACFDYASSGHMVKYTRGVKYVVGKDHPIAVPEEIILTITGLMDGDIVLPPREDIHKGDRVFIREGPFKDFYGIFERDLPGKKRVVILLEAIHYSLDIESESIRKA